METKAYFASSVPAALEVARRELGENALLVSSRPAPAEARQLGRLEVTFAWDPHEARARAAAAGHEALLRDNDVRSRGPASATRAARTQLNSNQPSSDMDEIRQQLASLRVALSRGQGVPEQALEEDSWVKERLAASGLSPETAEDIAEASAHRPGNRESAVLSELVSRIAVAPFVDMKDGESRTLAFIGQPGRGKTTSLVKIAVTMGLARKVPVRIYGAGAQCVGAQEQLTRYGAILGVPCQAFESLASLNLALNGENWRGLALIDTPGLSPADRSEMAEFRSFFAARPEIEKHLVLRADTNLADIASMIGRFEGLEPSRLLFTGMDETPRMTSVAETLMRSGIPGTFCGTGQRIPEDIEEISPERLAPALWLQSAKQVNSEASQARSARAAA
jgi:flagellar biosynthesis protein FlhF